jgi:membrane-bound lytic murein transglycosylase MltF
LIGLLVVDSHQAEFWAQIFPDIALHPDVALRTGSEIARAIRKDRPKLRAALDAFGATHEKGTAFGNELAVGDVQQTEPNVHAGVKYIRLLLDRYYKDEPMDDTNHMLFALAS